MDLLSLLIVILGVLLSAVGGYALTARLFSSSHPEIKANRAFQEGRYEDVIQITTSTKSISSDLLLLVARSFVRLNRYEQAFELYEKTLTKVRNKSVLRANILQEQGDLFVKQADFTAAYACYCLGLKENPKDSFLLYKRAHSLYRAGNLKEARLALRSLLKDKPALVDARFLYAEILALMGFYTKAIGHYGILDRAGEKIVSYGYARTLKALKIMDRAIQVYRTLLDSDVDKDKRNEMLLECAELYKDARRYDEGMTFIEDTLPVLKGEMHMEMQYLRARLQMERGNEYVAYQEFILLFEENPQYKDLRSSVFIGEKVIKIPELRNYFTADAILFENTVLDLLPVGTVVLKRLADYYVFMSGNNVYLFYRHAHPASAKILDDPVMYHSKISQSNAAIEIWSFSGLTNPPLSLNRGGYTLNMFTEPDFPGFFAGNRKKDELFRQLSSTI